MTDLWSLDTATQLVVGQARLKLFPGALEASTTRVMPRSPRPKAEPNPSRNVQDAARRARTVVRRYAAHNRLQGFATLTFAGTARPSYTQCRSSLARLMRTVRIRQGERLPYVFLIEPHELEGHHGHLLLPARALEVVEATWRRGSADLQHLDTIQDIHATATYLGKTFDTHHEAHRQRYAAAQGFAPTPVTIPAQDFAAAARLAELLMGRPADSSVSPAADTPGHPLLLEWSDLGGET